MKNEIPSQPENEFNEKAWILWNKLEDFSSELWHTFYQYFLQKCIDMDDEEYEKRCHK